MLYVFIVGTEVVLGAFALVDNNNNNNHAVKQESHFTVPQSGIAAIIIIIIWPRKVILGCLSGRTHNVDGMIIIIPLHSYVQTHLLSSSSSTFTLYLVYLHNKGDNKKTYSRKWRNSRNLSRLGGRQRAGPNKRLFTLWTETHCNMCTWGTHAQIRGRSWYNGDPEPQPRVNAIRLLSSSLPPSAHNTIII